MMTFAGNGGDRRVSRVRRGDDRNTITFTPAQGDPYTMAWNGDSLLIQAFEGLTLAYLR